MGFFWTPQKKTYDILTSWSFKANMAIHSKDKHVFFQPPIWSQPWKKWIIPWFHRIATCTPNFIHAASLPCYHTGLAAEVNIFVCTEGYGQKVFKNQRLPMGSRYCNPHLPGHPSHHLQQLATHSTKHHPHRSIGSPQAEFFQPP